MDSNKNTLQKDFLVPPFSVFDTRSGAWQKRKQEWKKWLGNTNETREGVLYDNLEFQMPDLYVSSMEERERLGLSFREYVMQHIPESDIIKYQDSTLSAGASSFDPVVAELACRWFAPYMGARVFDCFAGGITKGAVANRCGHEFVGIELRSEQVEINRKRCAELGIQAKYIEGDGKCVTDYVGYATQDLLLSCPPYYNLETYSENPKDASNQKTYIQFLNIIESAYANAIQCLKSGRFAVIVVGDVRENNFGYIDFPGDIIRTFQEYGCQLYNDIILVGNDVNARVKARRYMNRRKVVRTHQRVLVFYKGRVGAIPKTFGDILPAPEL